MSLRQHIRPITRRSGYHRQADFTHNRCLVLFVSLPEPHLLPICDTEVLPLSNLSYSLSLVLSYSFLLCPNVASPSTNPLLLFSFFPSPSLSSCLPKFHCSCFFFSFLGQPHFLDLTLNPVQCHSVRKNFFPPTHTFLMTRQNTQTSVNS